MIAPLPPPPHPLPVPLPASSNPLPDRRRYIMTGLKSAGFSPFFVERVPTAHYLQMQEGNLSLYSGYEISLGNTYNM